MTIVPVALSSKARVSMVQPIVLRYAHSVPMQELYDTVEEVSRRRIEGLLSANGGVGVSTFHSHLSIPTDCYHRSCKWVPSVC
jgi:hypothetical protein